MDNCLIIPQIIHICWFSKDPYPVEIKFCMDSWKRILPDYRIRLWTIEDALALNYNYVNEALAEKKWAFAADVVRVYAIYSEGGVYMDSDVFLKKRFDEFMTDEFVTFHECKWYEFQRIESRTLNEEAPFGLQAAFMIGEKGNSFCRLILNYYRSVHFVNKDKSLNMRVAPYIYADIVEKYGFKYQNKTQYLESINVTVYESKFFASQKQCTSDECFGIHRISHSWKSVEEYPYLKRLEKKIRHSYKVCRYYFFKTC